MKTLVFTPSAQSDLDDILSYIAAHRPLTAVSVMARIREKCELLARSPEIGQRRPEFGGDCRSFPVQRWVVFYRITGQAVQIVRVLDGARDIDTLLG